MFICFEFKEFAEFVAFYPQTLSTFAKKILDVRNDYKTEKDGYESLFEDNQGKQQNLSRYIIKFDQIIKIFKDIDFRSLVRNIKGERIQSKK